MKRASNATVLFVSLIWLGVLLGVSFVATPVKFSAASLTLPVALDVGRVTFALFSKIEWGVFALLAFALVLAGWRLGRTLAAGALLAALAAQAFWLLPVLDARVAAIIAGEQVPATFHHVAYVIVELIKACLLMVLATSAFEVTARQLQDNRKTTARQPQGNRKITAGARK